MEMKRKIARLVMSSISNREGDDIAEQYRRLRHEVVDLGVGGYTVFGGNVDSTFALVDELKGEAPQPLLVSSDLERGLGQQLEGGTVFPAQMAIGATGSRDLAFAMGWSTGRESLKAGIDLVFSPVADVASEPDNPIIGVRSFGGDVDAVASMTEAFVCGCQQAGAAATAKHFPGHGDTRLDSHIELPTVGSSRELMEARELVPFRAAVDAGVRAVMTAHVAYPELTGDDTPATLSRKIATDMLRGELGFEGVLVSDALLMGAISKRYGRDEAALMALDAGVDILLMPGEVEGTIDGLREAVTRGRLSESRVDESLERIDELHRWLGDYRVSEENHVEFPPEIAGAFEAGPHTAEDHNHRTDRCGDHEELALQIARRAATLIRNEGGLVPIDAGAAAPTLAAVALVDAARPVNLVWLRSQLSARVPGLKVVAISEESTARELDAAERLARDADLTILALFDDVAAWRGRAGPSDAVRAIAKRLVACGPTAALVFGGPGTTSAVGPAGAVLCCYDGCQPSQIAAVEVLFGDVPASGRLPIASGPGRDGSA
jgi:beta-N-acetylhexosaminidase